MSQRLTDPDRGAAAILLAVLLGSGVLFGLLVTVVDMGQVYVSRRDSQDIADLVVTSLAYQCVTNASSCSSQSIVKTHAADLAELSTNGRETYPEVDCVQGSQFAGNCTPLTSTRYQCKPVGAVRYVRVYTRERTANSVDRVPLHFASLINGGSDVEVRSCAQAKFGQVATAPIQVPIIFSVCDFRGTTDRAVHEWKNQADYMVDPTASCSTDFDGVAQKGNFRGFFLIKGTTFDPGCPAPITLRVGEMYPYESSDICKSSGGGSGWQAAFNRMLNTPTIVPIARTIVTTGTKTTTITSFGQYVLKSYTAGGQVYPSPNPAITWPAGCTTDPAVPTSGNRCMYGHFTPVVLTFQEIDYTVANLGVNSFLPIP